MHRSINVILAWLPVYILMIIIFYFSHQPASDSSELSGSITLFVTEIALKVLPFLPLDIEMLHSLIRKSAHFVIYMLLGYFVLRALAKVKRLNILLAITICLLYAISDEAHQLFIPGRSGEIRDVLIDSAGATIGISIYYGVHHFMSRKKKHDWRR